VNAIAFIPGERAHLRRFRRMRPPHWKTLLRSWVPMPSRLTNTWRGPACSPR